MAVFKRVVYGKEVPETVAKFIVQHGGKVQTERVDPAWVFHKVTFYYTSYRLFAGEVGESPTYKYTLKDGSQILVTYLNRGGDVPDPPTDSWTTIYIYDGKDGRENGTARTETN